MVDTVDLGFILIKVLVQVQQKILIVMLRIINNTVFYCFKHNKKLFGFVLSFLKGWCLIYYKCKVCLVKDKGLHIFPFYNKGILNWFVSLVFGFQKGYFQYFQLQGMGYKFLLVKNILALKLGYSQRILFICELNIKCTYVTKYLLKINSRSLDHLKKISFFFFKTRKQNIYKKKGIFLKGSVLKIKLSMKKSKF